MDARSYQAHGDLQKMIEIKDSLSFKSDYLAPLLEGTSTCSGWLARPASGTTTGLLVSPSAQAHVAWMQGHRANRVTNCESQQAGTQLDRHLNIPSDATIRTCRSSSWSSWYLKPFVDVMNRWTCCKSVNLNATSCLDTQALGSSNLHGRGSVNSIFFIFASCTSRW